MKKIAKNILSLIFGALSFMFLIYVATEILELKKRVYQLEDVIIESGEQEIKERAGLDSSPEEIFRDSLERGLGPYDSKMRSILYYYPKYRSLTYDSLIKAGIVWEERRNGELFIYVTDGEDTLTIVGCEEEEE